MGEKIGVSGNWISLLESGDLERARPSDALIRMVEMMDQQEEAALPASDEVRPPSEGPPCKGTGSCRMIPVVSWAHAGEAESFEELPESWQDWIPTECRDERAFSVRLLGDSMSPLYVEGDLLVLQPSREIYSGCLAVVRLTNDGILFRRVERRADRLVLVPLNPQYKTEEFRCEEIAWAYPLWGMWRQVCK